MARLASSLSRFHHHAGTHEVGPLSSQTSLVLQHWRGELSLPVSFWLVGVLGNLVVTQASIGINRLVGGSWGAGIALSVFCLAGIFQSVGIWQSAGNSIKRTGKYLWPVLARLVAVFWVCSAVYVTLFHPDWVLESERARARPVQGSALSVNRLSMVAGLPSPTATCSLSRRELMASIPEAKCSR